ncbi:Type III pantothenate kinase [Ephemeroptericola cinctiostellae]|uniref:Type III pantothenate kinase n=1 Tax=Ephemeroptericola cinctiostellae TaxID=2268024 RepID=A0A345D7U8_9BURK|nr:type III pantothenate kinase [Ephemeroptericola cinctiostellae]AXF84436.1 Type III pantothenate kinase [Ephemeroptericola cinctiostellae]
MMLLIDIGNSRIKWLIQSEQQPFDPNTAPFAITHHDADWLAQLSHAWSNVTRPKACFISNVASSARLEQVQQLIHTLFGNINSHMIRPQKHTAHFTLAYDEVQQMGADRFAQLLGAQAICSERNHLVISAGTATTIDGVLAHGQHVGGVIAPSIDLMRTSLHQHTARLPLNGGDFSPHNAPRNTLDALASGARLARQGAVLSFMSHYMPDAPTHWLLCGGGAELLAEDLATWAEQHSATIQIVPSLCLLGVWQFSQSIDF